MTHESAPGQAAAGSEAGRQIAQLRQVLALVEQIAGAPAAAAPDAVLDEAARISIAYGDALPVVQRRFDALAAEACAWAAAGTEALIAAGEPPPRGAATRLARELRAALDTLSGLLRL